MSELAKIVLTACFTVLGGVIVLVFGQIIIRFVIDPIVNLKSAIGEVSDSLSFYGNIYTNYITPSTPERDAAHIALRQKATLLKSRAFSIPLFWVFSILHIIPSMSQIAEASAGLIGLSNSIYSKLPVTDVLAMRNKICSSLGFEL